MEHLTYRLEVYMNEELVDETKTTDEAEAYRLFLEDEQHAKDNRLNFSGKIYKGGNCVFSFQYDFGRK